MKNILSKSIVCFYLFCSLVAWGEDYNQHCAKCHQSIFELADTNTKSQWRALTYGKKLKEIHRDNLDVLAYLNSKAYNADKLYKQISFFAPDEFKDIKPLKRYSPLYANPPYCYQCHENVMTLAHMRTKTQWRNIENNISILKKYHLSQPKAVKYIESDLFMKSKHTFIKEMLFYAPNPQHIVVKQGNATFILDGNNVTKIEAYKYLKIASATFSSCMPKENIVFHLKPISDNTNIGKIYAAIITVGMVPFETKTIWELTVLYQGHTFRAQGETKDSLGWSGKVSITKEKILHRLLDNIKKDMNICMTKK